MSVLAHLNAHTSNAVTGIAHRELDRSVQADSHHGPGRLDDGRGVARELVSKRQNNKNNDNKRYHRAFSRTFFERFPFLTQVQTSIRVLPAHHLKRGRNSSPP